MSDVNPKLHLILERVGPGSSAENFEMWACRGVGRGCNRNRLRKAKKHCEDCARTDPDETLEALHARLQRGDA